MATEETERHELFDLLEAGIGSRGAALLMARIPPFRWDELATARDLGALRSELKGEMAGLRGETAELRGEMAELRAEVRGQLPKLVVANVASMVGVAGLVLAAGAVL